MNYPSALFNDLGLQHKTFIIAEAGVNHNGSLETALKLVDAAKACGADAVKFQYFTADDVVTPDAQKADYQKETTRCDESQYAMLQSLQLTKNEFTAVAEKCREVGILFLCSLFSCDGADFIDQLQVPLFKLPSGELTHKQLLKHTAQKNKPIIISTGMATIDEIREAITWIREEGSSDIIIMHCTSEYPADYASLNLTHMHTLSETFALPIGYSDHSKGIEASIAAVALDACVIERHFTLDTHMDGPDHTASLDPDNFRVLVQTIRNVEQALVSEKGSISAMENKNRLVSRRGLFYARDMHAGDVLTERDVVVLRPETGLRPKEMPVVVGKTMMHDHKKYEPVLLEHITQ